MIILLLVAVTLVPFAISNAYAETTSQERIDKANSLVDRIHFLENWKSELEVKKQQATNPDRIVQLESKIQGLEERIMFKHNKLLEMMPTDMGNMVITEINEKEKSDRDERGFNAYLMASTGLECDLSSSTATIGGNFYAPTQRFSVNWNFPSEIESGYFPVCTTRDYVDFTHIIWDVTQQKGCTKVEPALRNTGTYLSADCVASTLTILPGDLIIMYANGVYEGPTSFPNAWPMVYAFFVR